MIIITLWNTAATTTTTTTTTTTSPSSSSTTTATDDDDYDNEYTKWGHFSEMNLINCKMAKCSYQILHLLMLYSSVAKQRCGRLVAGSGIGLSLYM